MFGGFCENFGIRRGCVLAAIILGVFLIEVANPVKAVGSAGAQNNLSASPDLFTGALSYSVPIEVPPGRNGMQPDLALTYRSNNGNGWLGVGWELEVGAIERDTRYGLDYSGDAYVFRKAGAMLDLVNTGGGEYRAKIEADFIRFRKLPASDGRDHWEATDKTGRRYLFGQTTASRQDDQADANRIFKWCLEKVIDTHGNYMTYAYTKNQGKTYLGQIDYAGSSELQPNTHVKFYLANSSDLSEPSRLKSIYIYVDAPVRFYNLTYTESGPKLRSLLHKVFTYGRDVQVDANGNLTNEASVARFPEQTFDTTLVDKSECRQEAWTDEPPIGSDPGYTWVGDFNGDGFKDIASVSAGNIKVKRSTGLSFVQEDWATEALGTPQWGSATFTWVGDFNGDGKDDIATRVGNNIWVKCSTGSSFIEESWGGPYAWGSAEYTWVGDFDGDGKSDIATYYRKYEIQATPKIWVKLARNQSFDQKYQEFDIRLNEAYLTAVGDFDGDGDSDIATTFGGGLYIKKSRGDGYFTEQTYSAPFLPGTGKVFVGDFDGDGWDDIGRANGSFITVVDRFKVYSWPVTGSDWGTSTWVGDFNGDGLDDFATMPGSTVWLKRSTGSGFSQEVLTENFSGSTKWVGDFNFDGKSEIAAAAPESMVIYRYETSLYSKLNRIINGLGGTVNIQYDSSELFQNTQLPSPVEVVKSITVDDGNGKVSTATYDYAGGFHHLGERDFRGFNYAKVTGPAGPNGERSVSETWFHQGNDTAVDVNGPNVPIGYMKGKPYWVRVSDGTGNVYSEVTTTYAADADGVAPYFNPPSQVDTSVCDGNACGLQTRAVYFYDAYGNVVREDQYGDLNDPADDRTIVRSFQPNTTAWIVGLPASEAVYSGIGMESQASETTYYYDGGGDCSTPSTNQTPTQGKLTRVVRWLVNPDGTDPADPETLMGYDGYGNLVCFQDANFKISTITYDSSFTFPTAVTNPKGHQTIIQYYGMDGVPVDKGLYGQIKSTTDPNDAVVFKEYDSLGRISKVADSDTAALPYGSVSYFYENFGTPGQQKVTAYVYDQTAVCPDGYTFNPATNQCEQVPVCSAGTYNALTNQCETTSTINYQCSGDGSLFSSSTECSLSCSQTALCNSSPSFSFTGGGGTSFTLSKVMGNGNKLDFYHRYGCGESDCEDLAFSVTATGVTFSGGGGTSFTLSRVVGNGNKLDFYHRYGCGESDCEELAFSITGSAPPVYSCPFGSGFSCSGSTLACTAPASCSVVGSCPTGTTLSGGACVVEPVCANGGTLNPTTDQCELSRPEQYLWKETYFDGFGRTIGTISEGPNGTPIVTEAGYDGRGAVVQQSSPYFEGIETPLWTSITYDSVGRTIRGDLPDSSTRMACYDDGVTVTIDANGHRKRETHDALGRLIKVEEYQGVYTSCTTDAGSPYATTSYRYDVLGNLRFVTDARGNQTEMRYDTLGRKTFMHDPDMGDWTYAYDGNGNLVSQTDAKGQTVIFQYDALNRPMLKIYPTGSDVVLTYDEAANGYAKGRLTTMTDASGTTKTYYDDPLGKTIRSVKNVDGQSYTITASLDELGRISSVTYPDGETVNYAYDGGGNLRQAGSYATYASYNALGQPGMVTYGNGAVTTYQYNAANKRLWTINASSGAQSLLNLEYSYDPGGNVAQIFNYLDAAKAQSFDYDGLDRLTSAQSTVYGTLTYAYDQIGNFQAKEGIVYTPDAIRPHAVGTTSDGRSYAYDANGNMTADGQRTLAWDFDNRPTSITYGATTSFVYDGADSRVKKTGPAGTIIYIDKLYECSGGVCAKYIFAGGQRIALKSETATLYYHQDHLGSTGVVTDAQGNKVEDIFYKPFGESLLDSGAISLNHKYTGQEFDAETGLYFYNARYYNPSLGRFISADSIVPDPANPQAFHRYSYVKNNPLRYVDPTGQAYLSIIVEKYPDPWPWPDGPSYPDPSPGPPPSPTPPSAPAPAPPAPGTGSPHAGSVFYGTSAGQVYNYNPGRAEEFHNVLAGTGLLPGVGILPDAMDALLYAIEGDWPGLGYSGAAMIPLFGDGARGIQYGRKFSGKLLGGATKAINLPAWRKVSIDMMHITSGHMHGGSRVSSLKTLFPESMSVNQVETAVRQAYRHGERVLTQGDRVLVRGPYEGFSIEMWVNTLTKTIETAYPLF